MSNKIKNEYAFILFVVINRSISISDTTPQEHSEMLVFGNVSPYELSIAQTLKGVASVDSNNFESNNLKNNYVTG